MSKKTSMQIGIIGWRGLVGQVLLKRLQTMGVSEHCTFSFFSTKAHNDPIPKLGRKQDILKDAGDIECLSNCDLLISCQGSTYTQTILPKLLSSGWHGYWLDAASHLRTDPHASLILDPINGPEIIQSIKNGTKLFVGPNCCTSLLLLALQGLYQKSIVDHVTTHTYQAISGAGAQPLKAYLDEIKKSHDNINFDQSLLDVCQNIDANPSPQTIFNNINPWIDDINAAGWTKEELKFSREATRILGRPIHIDATCVRVNTLRCHSQSITLELNENHHLDDIKQWLSEGNDWVRLVDDTPGQRMHLSPRYVSNTLAINVGRIRKLTHKPNTLQLFTVGDQLLWGAAEPICRMLNFILTEDFQALGTNRDQVDCFK